MLSLRNPFGNDDAKLLALEKALVELKKQAPEVVYCELQPFMASDEGHLREMARLAQDAHLRWMLYSEREVLIDRLVAMPVNDTDGMKAVAGALRYHGALVRKLEKAVMDFAAVQGSNK